MKKIILLLLVCTSLACKKDFDKDLTSKQWVIESATVTPAMTIGQKTSTDYIELMGPSSCLKDMMITFFKNGTYSAGSGGALCDLKVNTDVTTWMRAGDQIILSSDKTSPMVLNGNKLTQSITSTEPGGKKYTIVYIFKGRQK